MFRWGKFIVKKNVKYKDLDIGESFNVENTNIEIIDKDRLCYRVKSSRNQTSGIRTISKDILEEFVYFFEKNPLATAQEARDALKNISSIDKFEYGYSSTLSIMAKRIIAKGTVNVTDIDFCNTKPVQVIYYGCPGSGKSYKVKEIVRTINPDFVFRTTFHPDTDYASFVGCYKPTGSHASEILYTKQELTDMLISVKEDGSAYPVQRFAVKYYSALKLMSSKDKNDIIKDAGFTDNMLIELSKGVAVGDFLNFGKQEGNINYKFIPQIFTNAYVKAWLNPDEQVYLIIEEINRGNCAQIFGDLFQLLDRDKATGYSEYPIKADKDLVNYLRNALGEEHDGIKNGELCLPPNLIIYATMNTSDQSLFPMDSAFKRRWEWEYVPINYGENIASGKFVITIGDTKYRWIDFLKVVNERIYQATTSEDKQMGNFFIKQDVDAKEFVNKVMFYLWNEVCKDEAGTQRNFFRKGKEEEKEFKFTDLFGDDQAIILNAFMAFLGISPIEELQSEEIVAE